MVHSCYLQIAGIAVFSRKFAALQGYLITCQDYFPLGKPVLVGTDCAFALAVSGLAERLFGNGMHGAVSAFAFNQLVNHIVRHMPGPCNKASADAV